MITSLILMTSLIDLVLVSQLAAGTGSRRLNRLPQQFYTGEVGGMSPCWMKSKTSQRADELS